MSTYLVTGGAGFIGSHLCDALLARGHSVRVLDDLSTGSLANLRPEVVFIQGDVADPAAVEDALDGADGCFHLAAIASVEKGMTDWLGTHRTNITGTIAVFDAIRRKGNQIPVVYASSAAVYGDCQTVPITEASGRKPLSAYGADKYSCELHARVASHVFGIPTTGLRFFNVYGPRQDPSSPYSGVLSLFMKSVLTRSAPTIFGDGEQSRDFTYVEDVATLLRKAGAAEGVSGQVYNAGNGGRYTLNTIWDEVQKLEGITLPAKYGPPREGDVRDSQADTRSAVRDLGHSPRFSIEEGLRLTLDWYRAENA